MKLLGVTNGKQVLASISHYDCRSCGELGDSIMQDGGAVGTSHYAGYSRRRGKSIWFEVAQDFAELYNDYNLSLTEPRKYGIWDIKDVKILSPEEIPDIHSFEYQAENEIWGTNGLSGKDPTKYVLLRNCSKDHLQKISQLCESRGNSKLKEVANYWLRKKE